MLSLADICLSTYLSVYLPTYTSIYSLVCLLHIFEKSSEGNYSHSLVQGGAKPELRIQLGLPSQMSETIYLNYRLISPGYTLIGSLIRSGARTQTQNSNMACKDPRQEFSHCTKHLSLADSLEPEKMKFYITNTSNSLRLKKKTECFILFVQNYSIRLANED